MMLKLVNVAWSGFALYLESAGEVCPQGVPLRRRWEVSSGVATSMPRAFSKFRFRGCFRACWLTGTLTGARCQPLQCDLPMPSFK